MPEIGPYGSMWQGWKRIALRHRASHQPYGGLFR